MHNLTWYYICVTLFMDFHYNFMYYHMYLHAITYGKAYAIMEIHIYVFPLKVMDFLMDYHANTYGNA